MPEAAASALHALQKLTEQGATASKRPRPFSHGQVSKETSLSCCRLSHTRQLIRDHRQGSFGSWPPNRVPPTTGPVAHAQGTAPSAHFPGASTRNADVVPLARAFCGGAADKREEGAERGAGT